MSLIIAGAAQTWPEFRITIHEHDGVQVVHYQVRTAAGGQYIEVSRDTYLAAVETSKLSALQDISALADTVVDAMRMGGKL